MLCLVVCTMIGRLTFCKHDLNKLSNTPLFLCSGNTKAESITTKINIIAFYIITL